MAGFWGGGVETEEASGGVSVVGAWGEGYVLGDLGEDDLPIYF